MDIKNLFAQWLESHCAPEGPSALARRLGMQVAQLNVYRSGRSMPRLGTFVRLLGELDPCLAGILEHFFDPEFAPEDYCRLTPTRAGKLFRRWLKRKLAESYATKRCPDGSAVALAADLGTTPAAVYGWTKEGTLTLGRFVQLAELLEPALFEQIKESLNLK